MNARGQYLDSTEIRGLFTALSDALARDGLHAQMLVVGGAAIALGYDRERATMDIDAAFEPSKDLRALAERIADEHGLPHDWLNDGAKGFFPRLQSTSTVCFESESLLVEIPSTEFLLAMKLHASRDEQDLSDAITLFRASSLTSADDAMRLLQRSYPPAQLTVRHQYVAEYVASTALGHPSTVTVETGQQRPHQPPEPGIEL